MKFAKKYEEYMKGKEEELPTVGLKKLKKMLKRCRRELKEHHQEESEEEGGEEGSDCLDGTFSVENSCRSGHCQVCDGSFFPSLLEEMSAVVGCFNKRAKRLLRFHLASGFKKYLLRFLFRFRRNHGALIKEGRELVTYAIVNAVAMRKILKKYDKVHYSNKGQAFKARAQSLHIEILQSPWLCELMAFYINLRQSEKTSQAAAELFGDCALTFDDEDKPTLSCSLFDSMRVDINLTCSICLDTVFDPVSLACGHIFCYMCCCSAASVTIVDGLKLANPKAKCPLCRRQGVFAHPVRLDELHILLRHSCSDYWEKRVQIERAERVRQAKQHWESQLRAFTGI